MYFTEKALKDLKREYAGITGKHAALMQAYLGREYKNARAKEFAQHGFLRRVKSMARSITNVFTLLPPERSDPPGSEERHDAEINIQAFLFNTFAATDNLAWIWVGERNITKPDGTELAQSQVGLRKQRIRESFAAEFLAYLETLDAWFGHLENFRHALAHRIPLYIPPYMIDPKDEKAYRDLEAAMNAAMGRYDFEEYERLSAAQKKLAFFRPWMTHSFSEKSKNVVFHAQLLADFNTIDELGRKMLEELGR
jgi:hypothetical protein